VQISLWLTNSANGPCTVRTVLCSHALLLSNAPAFSRILKGSNISEVVLGRVKNSRNQHLHLSISVSASESDSIRLTNHTVPSQQLLLSAGNKKKRAGPARQARKPAGPARRIGAGKRREGPREFAERRQAALWASYHVSGPSYRSIFSLLTYFILFSLSSTCTT
jgi:hypothetical protein